MEDRILKIKNIEFAAIKEEFNKFYPKKMLTCQQLINSLKEKGIIYDYSLRCDSMKGSYVGCTIKTASDADNVDFIDDEPNEDYKALYLKAMKKIQQLENRIAIENI